MRSNNPHLQLTCGIIKEFGLESVQSRIFIYHRFDLLFPTVDMLPGDNMFSKFDIKPGSEFNVFNRDFQQFPLVLRLENNCEAAQIYVHICNL